MEHVWTLEGQLEEQFFHSGFEVGMERQAQRLKEGRWPERHSTNAEVGRYIDWRGGHLFGSGEGLHLGGGMPYSPPWGTSNCKTAQRVV